MDFMYLEETVGRTLLDEIAIKAMVAYIQKGECYDSELAAKSYGIASSMIEEKAKAEKRLKDEKND